MTAAVVITGLGTIGASGAGPEALAADLASGEHRATPIQSDSGDPLGHAVQVEGLDLSEWIHPRAARRMSRPSRFAAAAARMALDAAALEVETNASECAVSMASNFGPLSYTQALLDQIHDGGPESASPALFTECVVNAPASQVSIVTRATGPNTTISGREAGPLLAIARGCTEIAEGRARASLAGSCEEITPLQFDTLSRLRALARGDADRMARPLPFDRRRNGFVLAEGATVLVLENEAMADRRGAKPVARVRAWGAAFDPTASRTGWGRGHDLLARELRACLDRAGVTMESISLIVSGASGSRAGDALEARTLQAAWGPHDLPTVVAPKSITGEYGGGFLASAVLALRGAIAPPSDFQLDEALSLVPEGVAARPGGCVLVTSLASGGSASWLVLEAL